jgi:hypothetical protein
MTQLCLECNARITKNTKRDRKFCGSKCRNDFNMRRRVRGAELYDLFMACRFERDKAKEDRLWGVMCSLASAYRDSDTLLRQGRKSWDADAAYARIPIGFSKGSGDKR